MMDIVDACKHPDLFRPFLTNDGRVPLSSFAGWFAVMRTIWGKKLGKRGRDFMAEVTDRDPDKLNPDGYERSYLLTGRRSGKSLTASICAAYMAAVEGNERKLTKGDTGLVVLCSFSKSQAAILKNYVSQIFQTPLLAKEVEAETRESFILKNGIEIRVITNDWRSCRGFSIVGAVIDEICFHYGADGGYIKTADELVRALEPGTINTGGRIIAISSPFGMSGHAYEQYREHWGKDESQDVLIVNGPSRTFNKTLPQAVIDKRVKQDPQAAESEYFGRWRQDVADFMSRELLESLVVKGRQFVPPVPGKRYLCAIDLSGGRYDQHGVSIVHREGKKLIVDYSEAFPPGNSPYAVVGDIVKLLGRYGIKKVWGDGYGAEWTAPSFKDRGIRFEKLPMSKSELYAEFLPLAGSLQVELLDDDRLISEFAGLKRRIRTGSTKPTIDHAPGARDDQANATAAAVVMAAKTRKRAGVPTSGPRTPDVVESYDNFINPFHAPGLKVSVSPWPG